jgi:peptidoglycan/LPS O-acetylase OafA/YrhL
MNPWAICLLLVILSTGAAWVALDRSTPGYWRRLSVAAVFGFALGLVHAMEVKSSWRVPVKRLVGAGIGLSFAIFATYILNISQDTAVIAWLVGIGLGVTARNWSQHLTFS